MTQLLAATRGAVDTANAFDLIGWRPERVSCSIASRFSEANSLCRNAQPESQGSTQPFAQDRIGNGAPMANENDKPIPATASVSGGRISFDYVKGNFFRVIHVDGAIGGITPGADGLHFSLFSERAAIPLRVTHEVENGHLGKEVDRQVRDAVIREVEVTVTMDVGTAVSFHKWLTEKIEELKKVRTMVEGQSKPIAEGRSQSQ